MYAIKGVMACPGLGFFEEITDLAEDVPSTSLCHTDIEVSERPYLSRNSTLPAIWCLLAPASVFCFYATMMLSCLFVLFALDLFLGLKPTALWSIFDLACLKVVDQHVVADGSKNQ